MEDLILILTSITIFMIDLFLEFAPTTIPSGMAIFIRTTSHHLGMGRGVPVIARTFMEGIKTPTSDSGDILRAGEGKDGLFPHGTTLVYANARQP